MIISKQAISRRTVLRGVGATLALPLLDRMLPASTALARAAAAPVTRFCCEGATFVSWSRLRKAGERGAIALVWQVSMG